MDPVIVVGAGMAGGRAFDALRKRSQAPVVLIGEEAHAPYNRPDLSKGFMLDQIEEDGVLFHSPAYYSGEGITFRSSTRAVRLEPDAHRLILGDDTELTYSRLLIATGGAPRRLAVAGADLPGIHYLRTIPDARGLRQALTTGQRLAVVGAGLVGLEIAAAARVLGLQVTVVDVCDMPFPLLGAELGQRLLVLHQNQGVGFRLGTTVSEFVGDERVERLVLSNGASIEADAAVVGIGIAPCTEWLAALFGPDLVKGTITTDDLGRTSLPDVYAAGDVTTWAHPHFGQIHSEQEAVAQNQGIRVASNIVGTPRPFTMLPYAWSDQYHHRLRTVGLASVDASDRLIPLSGPDGAMASVFVRGDEIVGAASIDWLNFVARVTKAMQSGLPLHFRDSLLRDLAAD
jgi:3-phenylpropionate/trans-cinnamate dioxygenase ferredoxin reductase component